MSKINLALRVKFEVNGMKSNRAKLLSVRHIEFEAKGCSCSKVTNSRHFFSFKEYLMPKVTNCLAIPD